MERIFNESKLQEELKNLKCFFCGMYLSVGPVFSISSDKECYKCGRCQFVETEFSIQALSYERVARCLSFPCIYHGCNIKLPFGEMEQHEKLCSYRSVQCMETKCKSQVKIIDLEKHFKKYHKVFVHKIDNLPLIPNSSSVAYLRKSEGQYLFVIRNDCKKIYAGVFSFQHSLSNLKFVLKIMGNVKTYPIIIFRHKIICYNERIHCIDCMPMLCNNPDHKFSKNTRAGRVLKAFLHIDYELCNQLFLDPSKIMYSVDVSCEEFCETRESMTDQFVNYVRYIIRKVFYLFLILCIMSCIGIFLGAK